MIDAWLTRFTAALRVHGRRRRRILEELSAHLYESAAVHGELKAIERTGSAEQVAGSFTPRLADRAFEQRDRIAALVMLAAMVGCLPLALELAEAGRQAGSWAWLAFFAFLAPTTAIAAVSCVAVLARRSLGARLARPLSIMVALTAVVVVLDLPPAAAEFAQYRAAIRAGKVTGGCAGRALAACAADHSAEIRLNYAGGAIALALSYLWAASGWTPRRPDRSQRDLIPD